MSPMAMDLNRTAEDAALDALRALDAAETELRNWRAHLERLAASPSEGIGHQAFHAGRVVSGVIAQAQAATAEGVRLAQSAESSIAELRSVS